MISMCSYQFKWIVYLLSIGEAHACLKDAITQPSSAAARHMAELSDILNKEPDIDSVPVLFFQN